jgi:uncharacterized protein
MNDPLIPLLGLVLSASLLGSLHCVGMCGPLLAFARGGRGNGGPQAGLWAYHLGRLLAYLALGFSAGWLGRGLDLSGAVYGFQRLALWMTGLSLVGIGLAQLASAYGLLTGALGSPAGRLPAAIKRPAQRLFARLAPRLARLPGWARPLGLGLLSAVLPCGWLYAFVALSAGLGAPSVGLLVMAAFWLGGLPALTLLGAALRRLPLGGRRLVPTFSALLLVLVGGLALLGRAQLAPLALAQAPDLPGLLQGLQETPACCEPEHP